jgi:hypothetical protein
VSQPTKFEIPRALATPRRQGRAARPATARVRAACGTNSAPAGGGGGGGGSPGGGDSGDPDSSDPDLPASGARAQYSLRLNPRKLKSHTRRRASRLSWRMSEGRCAA